MTTEYKFNTAPSDQPCENCAAADNVVYADSDFGPLSVSLCPNCLDPDYDPNAD